MDKRGEIDEELLERVRLGMNYLYAHGRHGQIDDIRELCDGLLAVRSDMARLLAAAKAIEAEDKQGMTGGGVKVWVHADTWREFRAAISASEDDAEGQGGGDSP